MLHVNRAHENKGRFGKDHALMQQHKSVTFDYPIDHDDLIVEPLSLLILIIFSSEDSPTNRFETNKP